MSFFRKKETENALKGEDEFFSGRNSIVVPERSIAKKKKSPRKTRPFPKLGRNAEENEAVPLKRKEKIMLLTSKQVDSLANLEAFQIAKKYRYRDLERLLKSLTVIYQRLQTINDSLKSAQENPQVDRKKRGSVFATGRRMSVNAISKLKLGKYAAPEIPKEKLQNYSRFEVEKALEKVDIAMRTHQVYKQKEKEKWGKWEQENRTANVEALLETRKYIPKNLKSLNEERLTAGFAGNQHLARRLVRNKVFLLFNMSFDDIKAIHPADLKNRYHFGGLDIVELRALYEQTYGLRREWRSGMKKKLAEMIEKDAKGVLEDREKRHPAYSNKPSFDNERRASVINAKTRRESILNDGGAHLERRKTGSVVAKQLESKLTQRFLQSEEPLESSAPIKSLARQKRESAKRSQRPSARRPSALESIYLIQKPPDEAVYSQRASRSENIRSTRRSKPKENIIDAFQDFKFGKTAVKELNEEDFSDDPKSNLEAYFLKRNEEDGDLNPDPADSRSSKREGGFDFDVSEFDVHPSDNSHEIKRKHSALYLKAFEMVNSDDVSEDDDVFMTTLRKLSSFSSTLSEFSDELEDDNNDTDTAVGFDIIPDLEREDAAERMDIYLRPTLSRQSDIQTRRSTSSRPSTSSRRSRSV